MASDKRLIHYVRDFPLFVEVLVFFFLLQYHVRFDDMSKLTDWVRKFRRHKRVSKEKLEVVVVFVDYVLHNVKGLKSTCLNRSLALFHFLSRMEESVILHFGVKKDNDELKGHGWLTRDGEAFLEKDNSYGDFKPVLSLSSMGCLHNSALRTS